MGINGTVVWLLHEDSEDEGRVMLECVSRGQVVEVARMGHGK